MNLVYLDLLKKQFNNKISFREKRPGIMQLFAPFYHEDGDMLDIFLQESKENHGKIRISDFGMTLMHLSYSYDIDSPNKERIFNKIVTENGLITENGTIYTDIDPANLYAGIFQFSQTVAKVSSMRQFKNEVVQGLFYEMLKEFVFKDLLQFNPVASVNPLPDRDDLEVDYALTTGGKPIYLFGIKGFNKARLATICCLEFQKAKSSFRSVMIHEDFEALPKKDRSRLTSAADKQFIDLEDFKKNGKDYLERESA
ncbi:DUF1828 domain-containing protein [Dehalobacterium formicoaceticum]|uniref:DUF1828 domain-containing protein n=1 Tax=Dehalobacterium formicoaceticum TaxID=51515 RepID=UPI000B7F129A|nr:DUF1828 domain-containing protein [Dehalobacterium formicoaceticum]